MFDKYEAVESLESLLRLARNENHQRADEYAAALDEIKTRSDFVDDQQLQSLFLGLLGDPVRAKVAKNGNAIFKGVGKVPPPPMPVRPGSTMRRPAPYQFSASGAEDGDISLGRAVPHQRGDSLVVVMLDNSLLCLSLQ